MNSIPVSPQGGIVVRRAALDEKQISESALLEAMEAAQPDSSNEQLLAFGPSFGEEAMNEFVRRLKALGLEYVDDFFFINIDLPDWCGLQVGLQ
jgi:hypothetical protein